MCPILVVMWLDLKFQFISSAYHEHKEPLNWLYLFAFLLCQKALLQKPAPPALHSRNCVGQSQVIVLQYYCRQALDEPTHFHRMTLLLHYVTGLPVLCPVLTHCWL